MPLQGRPDLLKDIRGMRDRVSSLEWPSGGEVLTPMHLADAAPVTAVTAAPVYVAVGTGRGSTISWMVICQPGTGTTLSMRLRDGGGNAGPTITTTAKGVCNVEMPLHGWPPGETRLVYLDAWVDTGTATILPVRAVGA